MKKKKKKRSSLKKKKLVKKPIEYDYHLPVMLKQCCDYLITDCEGTYIDGTLGGGGHTEEILTRLGPKGRLYSFDKDLTAIEHCNAKFADELSKGEESKLIIVNDCFSNAGSHKDFRGEFQGVLLDLGVSSRQLDESRRGFSYRVNSRLDMRFSSHGRSAEELLNAAKEEELENILRTYGEEPFSGRIARRIGEVRRASPLKYTFDLRNIIEEVVPGNLRFKALSRVFQALRIAVNEELNVLEKTLNNSLEFLAPGARIVIMSYHSLEDRIVKNFFRQHSKVRKFSKSNSDNDEANNVPKLKLVAGKPITADFKEITANPRARSAKLRVAEII